MNESKEHTGGDNAEKITEGALRDAEASYLLKLQENKKPEEAFAEIVTEIKGKIIYSPDVSVRLRELIKKIDCQVSIVKDPKLIQYATSLPESAPNIEPEKKNEKPPALKEYRKKRWPEDYD